jgi:hypothetical protein
MTRLKEVVRTRTQPITAAISVGVLLILMRYKINPALLVLAAR